jgi:hypothetical protein
VDSPQEYPSHPCNGGTIYPDLAVGATVTLRSGSGTELAQSVPFELQREAASRVEQLALYLASRRVNQLSLGAMKSAHWSIKLTVGDGTWSG